MNWIPTFVRLELTSLIISFPGSSLFRRKDPGNSWSRGSQNIDCLRGSGKSIMLHACFHIRILHFDRREWVFLYNQLCESYKPDIRQNTKLNLISVRSYIIKYAKQISIATSQEIKRIKTNDHMLYCSLYVLSVLAAWAHLNALSFHTFCSAFGSYIYNLTRNTCTQQPFAYIFHTLN